jgi:hypothetical protein
LGCSWWVADSARVSGRSGTSVIECGHDTLEPECHRLRGSVTTEAIYEFVSSGSVGTAEYRDGEWHVAFRGREVTHRLLREALAQALGAERRSIRGLANKILTETRPDRVES